MCFLEKYKYTDRKGERNPISDISNLKNQSKIDGKSDRSKQVTQRNVKKALSSWYKDMHLKRKLNCNQSLPTSCTVTDC